MKKAIFIIILLFIASNTNAFGQSLETRIETLETTVLSLELRIMELEKALSLASSSPEKKPINLGNWKNRANWRALEKGMTMNEVRSLLGEPPQVIESGITLTWWYATGNVIFDDGGKVRGWGEPISY
jgi:outer membrane protein assembly factor BamE (lipoprotein component of BamABCDE complex)